MARCASGANGFQDSVVISICGRNKKTSLADVILSLYFVYFPVSFIKFGRVPISYNFIDL